MQTKEAVDNLVSEKQQIFFSNLEDIYKMEDRILVKLTVIIE